jgi:hypothetical protein
MPSSLGIVYLVVVTAEALMFSYAAYWGFSIRRALYVRLYRNQALGTGLVAVSGVILGLGSAALFYNVQGNSNPGPSATSFAILGVLTLFYWIDTSLLAARRSDPLLRDTFHWRSLRVVFWVGIILPFGLLVSVIVYLLGPLALFVPCSPSVCAAPPPPWVQPVLFAPFLLTGVAGLFLLVAARRSRDTNLKRNLRWFGLFAVSLLTSFIAEAAATSPLGPLMNVEYAGATIAAVGLLAGGYFLYRSARALVPLNRIESGEFKAETKVKLGAIPSPSRSWSPRSSFDFDMP